MALSRSRALLGGTPGGVSGVIINDLESLKVGSS